MALLRLHLRRRSKPLLPRRCCCSSSSSSPFPPRPDDPNAATPSPPDPPPIPTSPFAEIRDRIKSSTTPPRRIPTFPPRPYQHQHHRPPPTPPPADLDEIRRSLALFHTPNSSPPPSAPSFVDLVRNSSAPTPTPGPGPGPAKPNASAPFSEILQRLRETRPDHGDGGRRLGWPSLLSQRQWQSPTPSSSLPESIFGREMKERLAKARDGAAPMLAYRRHYDPDTMGMRLRELRPTGGGKDGKEWFSLEELKGRLATLRENDEKARRRDPVSEHMRSAIQHIETEKEKKTAYMQGMSIFMNFGMKPTPSYMLKPPQEELLERYFHPDHMSAAEKMKLELQRVRDEFKMSEIDCGSARVQVAQLTTKIKHLSEALHKKDKHSRKGLLEMVQRRKKLLKYLRRTDWDSYCLVLSKLGLRDVPEYKPPDYKSKSSTKTKASKSKKKKKMKA